MTTTTMASQAPELVPLELLDDNPYQPRLSYDEAAIVEIATSIKANGLMQVPVGRRTPDGRVQLAFGHRRRRGFSHLAAQDPAAWGTMPIWIRDLDDETMARQAWAENRDRKDISAYEEAKAIERYASEFGWTQKQVADKLQLDRSTVTNKLRLLRLPQAALTQLQAGNLSERQAAALLPLMDLPEAVRTARLGYGYFGDVTLDTVEQLFTKAAGLDSGRLRNVVERLLDHTTVTLEKKPWAAVELTGEAIVSPTCKECPLRLKQTNRCPQRTCAAARVVAHRAQAAKGAATATGLPTTGYTGYSERDTLDGVDLAALTQIATEKKCGRLSVVYDESLHRPAHPVEGHPHCAIVCGHGPNKRCGCRQTLINRADPATGRAAREKHEKARIANELVPPAVAALEAALDRPSVSLWRHILGKLSWTAERKLAKDADRDAVIAALARAMVDEKVEYSTEVQYAEQRLLSFFQEIGLPSPFTPIVPDVLPLEIPTDPAGATRAYLAQARELAGVGMAHHFLEEARKAYHVVIARETDARQLEALAREIDQVAGEIARVEGERGLVDIPVGDVGAQTPPTVDQLVDGAGATLKLTPETLADLRACLRPLARIEERIAAGAADASDGDALAEVLDGLEAFVEVLDDHYWDIFSERLGDAEEALADLGVQV